MHRVIINALLCALVAGLAGCDSPPAPAPAASSTTEPRAPAPAPSDVPPGLGGTIARGSVEQPLPQAPPTAEAEPEVVAAQHLLVAYRGAKRAPKGVARTKVDAKKRAEEALARAQKGDDFTELVKAYSDEPGAAERLGNLGKFKRDAMVKPFADAAFKLKVGQVSDVVETEFGFHVIKRNQ